MDKQMLRTTITQLRQIALFAVGVSLLTACGNNQSGMKLGDNEFAVLAVNSTTSDQTTSYPATIRGTQDIEVRPRFRVLSLSYVWMKEQQFVKGRLCSRSIRPSMLLRSDRQKRLSRWLKPMSLL